jgi:parallel beta-helix repeat protein
VDSTCIGINTHTDGNGIIFDDWGLVSYAYAGLIESNIVFNNGGRGIEVNSPQNVTVANNVAFDNARDPLGAGGTPQEGDLANFGAGPTSIWTNNVAWSDNGKPTVISDSGQWTNNITTGDPMLDPVTMQPKPGSPVTAAGITPPSPGACTPGVTSAMLTNLPPPATSGGGSCSGGIVTGGAATSQCDSLGAAVTQECNTPTGPTLLCPGAQAQFAACQLATQAGTTIAGLSAAPGCQTALISLTQINPARPISAGPPFKRGLRRAVADFQGDCP